MPGVTRRSLLGSATSLVGCCACGPEFIQKTAAVAQTMPGSAEYGVKALFFDVFGTNAAAAVMRCTRNGLAVAPSMAPMAFPLRGAHAPTDE
jgi:hypothetical protein